MEIIIWLFKWVAGPLAAIVVTLLFTDPIKERFAPMILRLGNKKDEGVTGLWTATFFYGYPEVAFVEVVEVSSLFGQIVGRIVPHRSNGGAAKRVELSRPLRIKGHVTKNRYFSGTWLHPERVSHHRGTFDLIIRQTNSEMEGMWLGYSESKNLIETGRWVWKRIAD